MKKALINKESNRIADVVGPINPDNGTPITRDTAFPLRTPGYVWVDCDDDVTAATHDFDGARFVRKANP